MKSLFGKLMLLSAAACFAGTAADRTVIGRWRSLETSKGGIGAMFTFREDGTLDYSPGAVVESKYRVEGSRLIMPPATVNGPEQVWAIESLTRTELRLSQDESPPRKTQAPAAPASRPSMVMTREGEVADPKNLIVGTWQRSSAWPITGSDKSAGISGPVIKTTWQFRADGLDLLTIPFRVDKGRYTITDGSIRIEIGQQPVVQGKIRWDGDVLVLPGSGGSGESRFSRY